MRERRWQQTLRQTGEAAQQQLHAAMDEVNDRVVPEVRAQGIVVLRAAATGLRWLADSLDELTRSQPAPQRGAWTSTSHPQPGSQASPETRL